MPYTRPTAADVVARYSLRPSMMGYDDATEETEFEAALGDLIADAEDVTALNVGEAIFTGALDDRQARLLQQAVRLRTAAAVDSVLAGLKLAGEQEALLVEEAENLRRSSLDREGKAEELERAVALAVAEADEAAAGTASVAAGAFAVVGFTPTGCPSPAERIRAASERQNIEAGVFRYPRPRGCR